MDFKSQLWGSGFPWLCVGRQWLWWLGGSSTSFHGGNDSPRRIPVFWLSWWLKTEDLSRCILPWQDMTAGTQPFTLSGTSMLFVPEATSPSSDSVWKKHHCCQDEEEYQLLPQAYAARPIWRINGTQWLFSLFMHVSLWVCVRCCALSESLLYSKFVSRGDPSEVRIMHAEFMYIDKVNTSWESTLTVASQALMNSTSLECKIAPFGWMRDTTFDKFNEQNWPYQSQDVMPLRWSRSQFHPIQEMLRKGTQLAQEHM